MNTQEITVYDFLLNHTPVYSTWIIQYEGWREAIFWIDDEDLWTNWFPEQHMNKYVKRHTYDELTKTGYIEYKVGEKE